METLNAVTEQKQNMWSSPIKKSKSEEYERNQWKEAVRLVDFHASGQYMGTDGRGYKMTAEYASDSTEVFPIVLVTVTDENENISKYYVDITKIDTANATEIEMFALCSHADTKRGRYGDISDDVLSSWESLLFYRGIAAQEGYIKQDEAGSVSGAKKFNWRTMIHEVSDTYIEDERYDCYLHVNRMQDMLEYYSRFEGRPDAFADVFHAVRDYEFIRVLSLDDGTNIELYDKQKKIVCSDLSAKKGNRVLWVRELTEEELIKAIEIYSSPYKIYMKDVSFWDEILRGEGRLKDYGAYLKELKRQFQNDHMFDRCPLKVKDAWKYAEKKANFHGLGLIGESVEIGIVSEYMIMLTERMKKGMKTDLLGTTVDSAVDMAKQILKRLEEKDLSQLSQKDRNQKLKEKNFYGYFLEYLEPSQKYEPVLALL